MLFSSFFPSTLFFSIQCLSFQLVLYVYAKGLLIQTSFREMIWSSVKRFLLLSSFLMILDFLPLTFIMSSKLELLISFLTLLLSICARFLSYFVSVIELFLTHRACFHQEDHGGSPSRRRQECIHGVSS
jgi:hypothetical protein